MTWFFALLAVTAFVAVVAHIARVVAGDGRGSTPPPRSHVEELGSWVSQELGR